MKPTLREMIEMTKNIPISQGGLAMAIEYIVQEIEEIKERLDDIQDRNRF